mgnify:CR=1 FL=1
MLKALNRQLSDAFTVPSTSVIADACVRLGVPLRLAPFGIRPLSPGHRVAGRALPVRHYGSADIFLEAMGAAEPGDVLVIDNAGRLDEGCIGDLIVNRSLGCSPRHSGTRSARFSGVHVWHLPEWTTATGLTRSGRTFLRPIRRLHGRR